MPLPDETKSSHTNWLQIRVPFLMSVRLFFVPSETCVPAGDLECSPKNLGAYEFRHLVQLFGNLSNQTMAMREGKSSDGGRSGRELEFA